MSLPPDEDLVESCSSDEAEEARTERFRILIKRRRAAQRLDKYLQGRFPKLSRAALQKLIRDEAVTVNQRASKPSYDVNEGDVIEVTLPAPEPVELAPQPIPLDIIYEDEVIIALNKQIGIVCHPGYPTQSNTLANGLVYYSGQHLSRGSDPFRPGIVHRLDKNTTGVLLVAKTDEAHWRLARQFERRTIQKTYLAVVEGNPQYDSDVVNAPINIHPVVREKFAVLEERGKINTGKEAVTHYEVAERFGDFALVKLFPKTGRTHQLRVHMSHIGHPIVGDTLYGGRVVSEHSLCGQGSLEPIFAFQALHAWRISFIHPISQQPLELEAPFPSPLRRLMQILRKTRHG